MAAKKEKESASVTAGYDYGVLKVRGVEGNIISSRGNGDAVHRAMLLFTAGGGDIADVISKNKLDEAMKPHTKKQSGLKSMTLGIMLRKMVKDGTPVRIGKILVEKLNQKVELPKIEKIERKTVEPKAKKATKKASKRSTNKVAEAA